MSSSIPPFIFFGSPQFGKIVLADLIASGYIPQAVVCGPDKPFGRRQIITPPPVKELAITYHIPVIQPKEKPQVSDLQVFASSITFALTAAYAHIIPNEVLSFFPKGMIGIHPSLLPLYRGPSPIQTALLHGDTNTGISLYQMDDQVDHGLIIAQREVSIAREDDYITLEEKLAHMGDAVSIETIPKWLDGTVVPHKQDHDKATYTQKFITEDGRVDLALDLPQTIARKIRAFGNDPGVFTYIDGKRVKLLEVQNTTEGYVITKIIPEGKREQSARIILK
jgi:methionyl-tRNA formyltransferase